jgi:hypothetical protein
MGYMVDLDDLLELMSQLESSDAQTVMCALEMARSIPHVETRLSLLEHAARYCGSPELAIAAFTEMWEELKAFTAEEKVGQVEDIIRYGSKVSAIRLLAMQYAVELVERGELERNSGAAQEMLRFIAEVVIDKESEVVRKVRALLAEDP